MPRCEPVYGGGEPKPLSVPSDVLNHRIGEDKVIVVSSDVLGQVAGICLVGLDPGGNIGWWRLQIDNADEGGTQRRPLPCLHRATEIDDGH